MITWKNCPLPTRAPRNLKPFPVPHHYMHWAEQQQVRQMKGPSGRPAGDHRSAEAIIEHSSVTKNFLKGCDFYQVVDDLKRQVGDWTQANPDPQARADAAYDLDKVLRFLDNVDDRTLNGSDSRNGHIEGFSNCGYGVVKHSEADLLRQFSRYGYEVLRTLRT